VAPITATIRSIPTELVLTVADGMPTSCAVNFDNLQAVPKSSIAHRITQLTVARLREATAPIEFALAFDTD
jgi:mRNA interferase MazF